MAGEVVNPAIPHFNASQRLVVPVTFGPTTASGTSSATGATSLTDSGASFVVDVHIGKTVYSNGSSGVVTTNSATVLTVASWTGGTPTAVKPYQIAAAGINGPMGTVTLGTISSSGLVMVRDIMVVGNTTLTAVGAASTMAFGVVGSTSQFLGTSGGDATALTAGKLWNAAAATGAHAIATTAKETVIVANIVLTIAGENILTGALTAYIYWDPISSGATLT